MNPVEIRLLASLDAEQAKQQLRELGDQVRTIGDGGRASSGGEGLPAESDLRQLLRKAFSSSRSR